MPDTPQPQPQPALQPQPQPAAPVPLDYLSRMYAEMDDRLEDGYVAACRRAAKDHLLRTFAREHSADPDSRKPPGTP